MKWIYTFFSGVLLGALGLFYLGSSPSDSTLSVVPVTPALHGEGAVISTTAIPVLTPIERVASITPAPAVESVTHPLLIPVSGISANQLIDTFNQTRGGSRRHEAIDISAPKGTPVFAVADGTVAKLFNSKPGGLTVYQFDASEKFAYYYAHLDRYTEGIKEGSTLKRGDLIGYVGSTGNANPATPHLHFAIFDLGPEKKWWKGSAINPFLLLGGVQHP